MRLGEECPYITPCGWCSRKEAPCDSGKYRKKSMPGVSGIPAPPPPGEKKGFQKKRLHPEEAGVRMKLQDTHYKGANLMILCIIGDAMLVR